MSVGMGTSDRYKLWERWGLSGGAWVPREALDLLVNGARLYAQNAELHHDKTNGPHLTREAVAYVEQRLDAQDVLESLGKDEPKTRRTR